MQDKRREAIEWLIRLQEMPEDAGLRAGLETWLAQDPSHAALWHDLTRLDAALGVAERNRKARRRAARVVVAAALTAGLGWFAWPVAAPHLLADHASGSGEIEGVALPDGSQVTLAPLSAVSVEFSDGARRVRLLNGQAWFEVRPGAVPFRVLAGEVETTVLGTAFVVTRTDDGAEVAVARGGVRVENKTGDVSARLQPGEAIAVSSAGARRQTVNPYGIAAWRHGQLIVRDRALGDVVAALRPWLPGLIVIRGERFHRQVTGVYDLSDPEAALDMLARAHGLRVTRVSRWVTIISS